MGFKARSGVDEALAERVRKAIGPDGTREIRMFGGLCFTINGNMACGVLKDEIMVRVHKDEWEPMLAMPHARVMDFTGKPLRGFVYVAPAGIKADNDLQAWVDRGAAFARSLPAK